MAAPGDGAWGLTISHARRSSSTLLSKGAGERDAFLATRCDETTARRVRELLLANDTDWFISHPLVASLASLQDGELQAGTRIGDYEITERLASGGMGHVYRARHLKLECDHAIKVLRGGEARDDERLLVKARHTAQLSHPNICKVYQVGQFDGRPYLVMEFVHGTTLQQELAGAPLPVGRALSYAAQVAEALVEAHAAGVVHGDLKPANIMVDRRGQVKVLDFGVARRVSESNDAVSSSPMAGTLPYMPPEALRGEPVDARGDLWSFGVVLYEMMAGTLPFVGGTRQELSLSILQDNPRPSPSIAGLPIEPVVRRCLDREVQGRYQTAGEVRADLDAAAKAWPRPGPSRHIWLWAGAALVILALAVSAWLMTLRSAPRGDRASVAVLPLESLSGTEDDQFADGLTEVLIGDLAQVRAIRVISRQSTVSYRGTSAAPAEIARTLGVQYLVKGTVTRAGGQVRVTAQLLDPYKDEHLWSTSTTRPFEDLLTLQNEVARDIARRITVAIRPEEERRLAESRPVRPEAFEAYLRGRALWASRSRRGLEDAAAAFRAAVQLEPAHAQSHSGLADTYAVQASLGFAAAAEAYPAARAAALEALRLDPALAEPHASLGRVKFSYEWDAVSAEKEFQLALAVNPGYATARQWYAVLLAARGRLDDALREARLAAESNPLSPIVHWNVARTHFFRREHQPASEAVGRALALDLQFALAHTLAARILTQERRLADAQLALNRVPAAERTSETLTIEACIAALRGQRPTALAIVKRLEAPASPDHGVPYWVARVYAALGEPDQAFAQLQRAMVQRSAQMVFLDVDPEFEPLRVDPRFRDLARHIGGGPR